MASSTNLDLQVLCTLLDPINIYLHSDDDDDNDDDDDDDESTGLRNHDIKCCPLFYALLQDRYRNCKLYQYVTMVET
jgi:hypothetical protein